MLNRLGGAEATDADRWVKASLEERDVLIEAKGAARSLVGHGDTKGEGVSGPPTPGSRIPPSMVSIHHGRAVSPAVNLRWCYKPSPVLMPKNIDELTKLRPILPAIPFSLSPIVGELAERVLAASATCSCEIVESWVA